MPLSPPIFLSAARSIVVARQTWLKLGAGARNEASRAELSDEAHRATDAFDTATFIAHVGYASHQHDGLTIWPFPLTSDCADLALLARAHGVLHEGQPEAGELLLQYSEKGQRYDRVSIVISANPVRREEGTAATFECAVVEGRARVVSVSYRTTPDGVQRPCSFETEVDWVCDRHVWATPAHGDRFVRWVDLDERGHASSGMITRRPAA